MASAFDRRLKSILTKAGLVDDAICDAAQATADREDRSLASMLIEEGNVNERQLIGVVARQMNLPPVDLSRLNARKDAMECLSQET